MYPFNRLLVGVALRRQDESTLKYASLAVRMTQAKRVYFIHIVDPRRPADPAPGDESGTPDHDKTLKRMQELVEAKFECPESTEKRFDVLHGQALKKMVEYAIDKDIDLIVIGSQKDATRVFSERVARNAPCSVLIVPEIAEARCDRILVPCDFSKLSAEAMKVAISCCTLAKAESLLLQHVLQFPHGYHKTGKSFDEVAEKMREEAKKDCDEFLKQFDTTGLPLTIEFAISNRVVKSIVESEQKDRSNIIFIGARGRTGPAAMLLGSVTEKLIRTTSTPLLAVKKKGANMTLLQAMFEL
jgi:nucleotide-binding universal stress UspA family protein